MNGIASINNMDYQKVNDAAQTIVPGNPISGKPVNGEISATGKTEPTGECQTCANRKYQDGSDEMVSFKSAQHISPLAAASRVRSHEQEHVSNAYKKAAQGDGKVLQASVRLQMSVCPECGRSYVSGGVTNTRIRYSNEENPYVKQLKELQKDALTGANFDILLK